MNNTPLLLNLNRMGHKIIIGLKKVNLQLMTDKKKKYVG